MKSLYIFLAVALCLLWNCETRTFRYVTTISRTVEDTVDQQGAFSEHYTIYASDINEELDLPVDAVIRGVHIEAFSIAVERLENNETPEVILDCYGGQDTALFANDVIVPTELSISYRAMSNLIATGVSSIREDLEGFVTDSDPPSITFWIQGDSHPDAGQRVNVRIYLEITITVGYELESEFLSSG